MFPLADRYSICLGVADTPTTCFIAMSFTKPTKAIADKIYRLIVTAATEKGLTASRTDRRGLLDFVNDIFIQLRAARIVVAVLIPETSGGSEKFSENVVYELGIAHAMGKPTIILASEGVTIPADFFAKYAILFEPDRLDDKDHHDLILAEIKNKMQDLKDRTKYDLIDTAWQSLVHVDVLPLTFCTSPDVRDSIKKIVSFSNQVYFVFGEIGQYISSLEANVHSIARSLRAEHSQLDTMNIQWARFTLRVNHPGTQELLCQASHDRVDEAFVKLQKLWADREPQDSISRQHETFTTVREQLRRYTGLYTDITTKLKEHNGCFDFLLKEPGKAALFVPPLQAIELATETATSLSGMVISNLIDMFD